MARQSLQFFTVLNDYKFYNHSMVLGSEGENHLQTVIFLTFMRLGANTQLLKPAVITSRQKPDSSWCQKQLRGHLLNYEGQRLLSACDDVVTKGMEDLNKTQKIKVLDHRSYMGTLSFNTQMQPTDNSVSGNDDDALGEF